MRLGLFKGPGVIVFQRAVMLYRPPNAGGI